MADTVDHANRPAYASLLKEMNTQDLKWGSDRILDPSLWQTILTEEVGEVSEASLLYLNALLMAKSGKTAQLVLDHNEPKSTTDDLRAELVQVAAVALQWVEMIDGLSEG